jgi:hypothetical protein
MKSRKSSTATYKNDRKNCQRTQHLPADCIPASLRLRRKQNMLIATFSSTKKPACINLSQNPTWINSFIENTLVTDVPKYRQLFSHEEL